MTSGIISLILFVVGVIMTIAGTIFLIVNQNSEKPWYIWFLLLGGGIISGVSLAISYSEKSKVSVK
jgi:hypothetical protein